MVQAELLKHVLVSALVHHKCTLDPNRKKWSSQLRFDGSCRPASLDAFVFCILTQRNPGFDPVPDKCQR